MPLFDLQPSIEGRRRVFARAQLPLLLGTAFVALMALVGHPSALASPLFLAGFGLIVAASISALCLPWERFPVERLAIVAAADFAGVAFLRAELLPVLPSIGFLIVFPLLWVAYGFGRRLLFLAIAGTLFTTALPNVLSSTWPSDALGWVNIVMLPVLASGVAVAVNTAAQQLLRSKRQFAEKSRDLTTSLRQVRDAEIVSNAMLETIDAAVAFYGADNRLLSANRIAHSMVGSIGFRLDRPPYAGQPVRQADRVTPIPEDEQIIPRALRGELIANHMEWLGPEGDQTAILATSRQAFREDGSLLGTLIVAYDVTPLANAIAVREDFLLTVSHELRTPLTSIVGYTELISDSVAEAADELGIAGLLSVVKRNADDLLERIGQLLTVSEKNIELHMVDVDVAEVASGACEKMLPLVHTAGHVLRVELAPGIRASIDPKRVLQVLENLLTNAIKYTPRGGTIGLTLRAAPGDPTCFELVVDDTGVGMSPAEQRQAFDRFFRAQAARAGAIQGVGVGLSIVKEIVEAHRGSIHLNSAPGAGATVTLTIPREAPANAPADTRAPSVVAA